MKLIKGHYHLWNQCDKMDLNARMFLGQRIQIDVWVILRSQIRDIVMDAAEDIDMGTAP
jgi:hypothetical protein